MSFEGLQIRLAALQETTAQLKELVDRLANLKFQPGSVALDTAEEGGVSGELSAEIGQLLRDGEDEKELLLEEVEFLRNDGHEKSRLQEGVERQGRELERCRTTFRRARLAAKRNLSQAQRLERELLVQAYSVPSSPRLDADDGGTETLTHTMVPHLSRHIQKPQTSSLSEKDRQTVGASSRATDSLRQMHASLQSELERSEYANQTMKESSATFGQLHESYSSLETTLSRSRDLLGTLMKSQKSDTWYLTTAFYMLAIVGCWLAFRRLLYGPMWWLVWLPLRVVFGVGSKAGKAVLSGRGEVGESGRADVHGVEEGATVDGLPSKDLPTAQVGQDSGEKSNTDADSMIDNVGQIIDKVHEADELGSLPNEDGEHDDAYKGHKDHHGQGQHQQHHQNHNQGHHQVHDEL